MAGTVSHVIQEMEKYIELTRVFSSCDRVQRNELKVDKQQENAGM